MSSTSPLPQSLSRDPWANLVLVGAEGQTHAGVVPVRMFPFSDPRRWIALLDAQRREVATIEDLAEIPPEMRQLIEEELRQREFLPQILRIKHVSSDTEPCDWLVETDRGETTFVLKSEDDIRRLAPYHYLVADALGMRYVVPDTRQLDAYSRRVMDEYV